MRHFANLCLRLAMLGIVSVLVTACADMSTSELDLGLFPDEAESASADDLPEDHYVQKVITMRKEARANPDSARLTTELANIEEEASTHYLTVGTAALNEQNYQDAIRFFELGLIAQPRSTALSEARYKAVSKREGKRLYADGMRAKAVGNIDLAQTLLHKAQSLDRSNPQLQHALNELNNKAEQDNQRYIVQAFNSDSTIDLNFKAAKLKDALEFISEPHSINFVFDPDIETAEVNVSAKRVKFEQAFHLLLQSGDCFHKVIGPNSILIAPNGSDKKDKYADFFIKTFHLQIVKAERMAEILSSAMELKAVVPNNTLNTVQVRDTRETLNVVERIIAAHDRMPAEVMLDVEILEINRSKSEQLGIDFGSQISAGIPQFTIEDAMDNFTGKVFAEGLVTIPTLTLRYFKNDVDARVLAKPRIRTIDGEPAKIHIGDRVPLRSATIQDATGQTRTTFEYRDIGIRLEVLPEYHLDNTISVLLKLEVSSLGQNLGTIAEPAFSIGTRNVDTTMILREGETAVLGGLIRDEERRRLNKVPGLGDMDGVVGRLFAVNDDEDTRTDILLTVTPRVLRHQSFPRMGDTDFYSGGKTEFTTQKPFEFLNDNSGSEPPPRYKLAPKGGQQVASAQPQASGSQQGSGFSNQIEPVVLEGAANGERKLHFGPDAYSVAEGDVVKIELRGENLNGASDIKTRILFNPEKLSLDSASPANGLQGYLSNGDRPGVIEFDIQDIPASNEGGEQLLATLSLRGRAKGLSYLLLNSEGGAKDMNGKAIDVELGSSKIEIR